MYLSANDRVTHNARRQDKRSVPEVPLADRANVA
jgi:hypothetical protein